MWSLLSPTYNIPTFAVDFGDRNMIDHLEGLKASIREAIQQSFDHAIAVDEVILQHTKKEFEGDYTLVVFPFTRIFRNKPEAIATKLGDYLKANADIIADYNVVKGFLNLSLNHSYWVDRLHVLQRSEKLGQLAPKEGKVLVEFSSPNTNKPLHLGHIRNILLGWSTSKILKAAGYQTNNIQIINDRGIAICKSMLAWQKFGKGVTPESSGIKGDHFVGKYYIEFEQQFRAEYRTWQDSDKGQALLKDEQADGQDADDFFKKYKNKYFNEHSALGGQAKEMLRRWESDDSDIRQLWAQMNGWVYDGFDQTYDALGVSFDKLYYESNTYLMGKDLIANGLKSDDFFKKDDGSVWVDLTEQGLDEKILLRSDGTSVYMTQDLGTAQNRYDDTGATKMIYVVADEQDYHFKVLFEIMKKLKAPFAEGLYHLSYGMVDLPTGRMKSREGRVVDADDLIAEVIGAVKAAAQERGELVDLTEEERGEIYRKIGLSALKFFILKVNPKKRMIFNPEESVDMHGQTGPYIQNAYVRIQSIKRRIADEATADSTKYQGLDPTEIEIIKMLIDYEQQIEQAAAEYDPSGIATYSYELAKRFHKFYHDVRVIKAESDEAKSFRLVLSDMVSKVLAHSMDLLGIEMPQRM